MPVRFSMSKDPRSFQSPLVSVFGTSPPPHSFRPWVQLVRVALTSRPGSDDIREYRTGLISATEARLERFPSWSQVAVCGVMVATRGAPRNTLDRHGVIP